VDNEGRRYIRDVDIAGWQDYLRKNGWSSYRDQARHMVAQGICDPLDAEAQVGELSTKFTVGNFDYRMPKG